MDSLISKLENIFSIAEQDFFNADSMFMQTMLLPTDAMFTDCESPLYKNKSGGKNIVTDVGESVLSSSSDEKMSFKVLSHVLRRFPVLLHCNYKQTNTPLWKELYKHGKFALLGVLVLFSNPFHPNIPAMPFDKSPICDTTGKSIIMSEVMTKELLYKLADKDIGQFFAVLNVTNPITGDSFLHYFAGGNTMRDGEGDKICTSADVLRIIAEITIQKTGKMPYELMKK
nr:MAG: hypothetical protein [White spot syndrome virus]BDX27761.1 MAG: hypothetical protein [White spot syndrome virus]BDX27921.1 MAG: hypothetical protein [White spot syndrome virus]BDX28083.1 MAG: hypothetical protein [White spot syndrome virus]